MQPGGNQQPIHVEVCPNHLKTQEMCDKAIEIEPFLLGCILDRYQTQEMLTKASEKDSSLV